MPDNKKEVFRLVNHPMDAKPAFQAKPVISLPARVNPNSDINPDLEAITDEDISQGYWAASANQFMKELNNVQVGSAKSDFQDAQLNQVTINSQLKAARAQGNIAEVERLESLKRINIEHLNALQDEVDSQEQDANDYYVNKIYSLKKQLVDSKGSDSGFLEQVKYGLIPGLGSQAGLLGASVAGQIAQKVIPALLEGVVSGPAAPFIIGGATLAAAGSAVIGSRIQETKSEVGQAVDSNMQSMVQEYLTKANKEAYANSLVTGEEFTPLTDKDIPEDVYDDIVLKANEGRSKLFKENMALAATDLAEIFLLPGLQTLGKVSTGSKLMGLGKALDYNKYTRLAGNIGGLALRAEAEKFEEGLQYAASKRQEADAFDYKNYSNKGFMKDLLTDATDVVTSMDLLPFKALPGEVRLGGRYSEDKEFQTSEESGGLLALFGGAATSAASAYSDFNKLSETKKQLDADDALSLEGKSYAVQNDILRNAFSKDSVPHLIEGLRALYGQKDSEGKEMYSEDALDNTIRQIKTAYKHYSEAEEIIDSVPANTWLGFKDSTELAIAREQAKKTAFNLALNKERLNRLYKENESDLARVINDEMDTPGGLSHSEFSYLSTKTKLDYLQELANKYKTQKSSLKGEVNDYRDKLEYVNDYIDNLKKVESLEKKLLEVQDEYTSIQSNKSTKDLEQGKVQLPLPLKAKLEKKVNIELASKKNQDDNTEFLNHLKEFKLKEYVKVKKEKQAAKAERVEEALDKHSNPLSSVADKATNEKWKAAGYAVDGSEPLVIEVNGEKKLITFGERDADGKHTLFIDGKRIYKLPEGYRIVPKDELTEDLSDRLEINNQIDKLEEEIKNKEDLFKAEEKANRAKVIEKLKYQKDMEELLETYPTLSEISPLDEVRYRGMLGYLNTDPDTNTIYFKDSVTGKEYELTKNEEGAYEGKSFEHGVLLIPKENPIVAVIDVKNTSKGILITIDGKPYYNQYSNPEAAINRDKDGNVISVTLHTYNGQVRTFKKFADELAYSILLYLNSHEGSQFRKDVDSRTNTQNENNESQTESRVPEQDKKSKELEDYLAQRASEMNTRLSEMDNAFKSELDELKAKLVELNRQKSSLGVVSQQFGFDTNQQDTGNFPNNNSEDKLYSFNSPAYKKATLFSTTASEEQQDSDWAKAMLTLDRNKEYQVRFFTSSDPEYGDLISEDALATEDGTPAKTVIKVILLDKDRNPVLYKGKVLTEYIHTGNWINNISEKSVVNAYLKRLNINQTATNVTFPVRTKSPDGKIKEYADRESLLADARKWTLNRFNSRRAAILNNIKSGNAVYSTVKRISNGIPNLVADDFNPVIGTFVSSKSDIDGIIINDGKSKNPIISKLPVGVPHVMSKNGSYTPLKSKRLSNEQVDMFVDLLDYTLNNTSTDPINSIEVVSEGKTKDTINIFNNKNKSNGGLISRLIWWGPSKTKNGKKKQIYYSGKGKSRMLHFGDKVIPVSEIKTSDELRLFLLDTWININKGMLENKKNSPLFYLPLKFNTPTETGAAPTVEVKEYKEDTVSAYENYLLDQVVTTNIVPVTSKKPQFVSIYLEFNNPKIVTKETISPVTTDNQEKTTTLDSVTFEESTESPFEGYEEQGVQVGDAVRYKGVKGTVGKLTKGNKVTLKMEDGSVKTNVPIASLTKDIIDLQGEPITSLKQEATVENESTVTEDEVVQDDMEAKLLSIFNDNQMLFEGEYGVDSADILVSNFIEESISNPELTVLEFINDKFSKVKC